MDVPACGRECPGFEAFGQLGLDVACRKQEAPGKKRAEFLFHVHDSWFRWKVSFFNCYKFELLQTLVRTFCRLAGQK